MAFPNIAGRIQHIFQKRKKRVFSLHLQTQFILRAVTKIFKKKNMKRHILPFLVILLFSARASAQSSTFNYTGSVQSYTAPVTGTYAINMAGGSGGASGPYQTHSGGTGGRVQCSLSLTAGQVLSINVAKMGTGGTGGFNSSASGGYIGGGAGYGSNGEGYYEEVEEELPLLNWGAFSWL